MRCKRPIYLLGGFEVLEDAVDGASIHEEVILDTLHHHPKTTSFETVGHLSSPTTYHCFHDGTQHSDEIHKDSAEWDGSGRHTRIPDDSEESSLVRVQAINVQQLMFVDAHSFVHRERNWIVD